MPELPKSKELTTLTESISELESYWRRLHVIQRTIEDLHKNLSYKIIGCQELGNPKPTPDPDSEENALNLDEIINAYRRTISEIDKTVSNLNQLI